MRVFLSVCELIEFKSVKNGTAEIGLIGIYRSLMAETDKVQSMCGVGYSGMNMQCQCTRNHLNANKSLGAIMPCRGKTKASNLQSP